MSGDLPDILELTEVGEHRYHVFQPSESAEGRDVVFSGQLMAQMMMASNREAGSAKDIRSVHAIFARPGTYTMPIEVAVDSMQAGRTWASDTVTATQGGKLLSRAMILMNTVDDDLMRHEPAMPDVPRPRRFGPRFRLHLPRRRVASGARRTRDRRRAGGAGLAPLPAGRGLPGCQPGHRRLGHLRQHHRPGHAPPPRQPSASKTPTAPCPPA